MNKQINELSIIIKFMFIAKLRFLLASSITILSIIQILCYLEKE